MSNPTHFFATFACGWATAETREAAIENGMVAMRRAGLLMAQNGKTTMSEVLRKAFILG